MKHRFVGRFMVVGLFVLSGAIWTPAQTSIDPSRPSGIRGELTGTVGGSALVVFGAGAEGDGMWGMKLGALSRNRRFGVEGTFEQSIRAPEFRYFGGDFILQFVKLEPRRPIPFLHVGAGAFVYERHGEGALSFGAGVKQYINEHIGLRFGIQDRMLFRQVEDIIGRLHRLDFYGGIVIRF